MHKPHNYDLLAAGFNIIYTLHTIVRRFKITEEKQIISHIHQNIITFVYLCCTMNAVFGSLHDDSLTLTTSQYYYCNNLYFICTHTRSLYQVSNINILLLICCSMMCICIISCHSHWRFTALSKVKYSIIERIFNALL